MTRRLVSATLVLASALFFALPAFADVEQESGGEFAKKINVTHGVITMIKGSKDRIVFGIASDDGRKWTIILKKDMKKVTRGGKKADWTALKRGDIATVKHQNNKDGDQVATSVAVEVHQGMREGVQAVETSSGGVTPD